MTDDSHWMNLALAEARKGVGKTAPNPPVGAVVVKDDVLLGAGWHQAAGRPHAEREALTDALAKHGADAVRGATVYITLEPCSTHGRTPPCTDALIEAAVARVVYATADPDPRHAGRADSILTAAGIEISTGVCQDDAQRILRPFFKVQSTGLPWVIWKSAMSLDGRITRPPGEGPWITGEPARADVQILRASVDAILSSGTTVRRDRPALTIRQPKLLEGRTQPWRVVFSDHPDSLPADAPLFTDAWRERTLIRPRHDLAASLRNLVREQGVLSAMTEAGGVFSAALFEAGLIDEVVVYVAPILCGNTVPALVGSFWPAWPASLRLLETNVTPLGNDFRFRGIVAR
jgi:diaminohydroxyphosphoribosylaminopyrimidine deaminase/5-amino-6-(5-phosphoribosylamino)uracil reductase